MRKRFYRKNYKQLRLKNKVNINNFYTAKKSQPNKSKQDFLYFKLPHYIVLDNNFKIKIFENKSQYKNYKATHKLIKRYIVHTTKQQERRKRGFEHRIKILKEQNKKS